MTALPREPLVVTPAGHDVSVWSPLVGAAPVLSVTDIARRLVPYGRKGALLVAGAHPDDETIGLGRFCAQWADRIGAVSGLLATAGEACFDHVMARPEQLKTLRIQEWRNATSHLGFDELTLLNLPDGAVSEHEYRLRLELRGLVERRRAAGEHAVLAAPWRHDPHPDHQAVGRATARVAHELVVPLIEYGVWMTYWSEPTGLTTDHRELVVLAQQPAADAAYARACGQFASQFEPFALGITPVVPEAMMAHHQRQLLVMPRGFAARRPETQSGSWR